MVYHGRVKDGAIVHHCNLEEERRSNRSFVELEVTGDDQNLRMALPEIGAEGVSEGGGRWRIVLPRTRSRWSMFHKKTFSNSPTAGSKSRGTVMSITARCRPFRARCTPEITTKPAGN